MDFNFIDSTVKVTEGSMFQAIFTALKIFCAPVSFEILPAFCYIKTSVDTGVQPRLDQGFPREDGVGD